VSVHSVTGTYAPISLFVSSVIWRQHSIFHRAHPGVTLARWLSVSYGKMTLWRPPQQQGVKASYSPCSRHLSVIASCRYEQKVTEGGKES
jgi:hypothetical protein